MSDRRNPSGVRVLLREPAVQDEGPALYGRGAEQAALLHAVKRLAAGSATATVIHGPPGSGRSRLLRRGAAIAKATGAQVMTALGSAEQMDVPYAFMRQLEVSRPGHDPVHGRPVRAGVRDGEESVEEWCRVLVAAAHWPTLIALDDVQWADRESVEVIRALLRRLASVPLTVLLTVTGARGEFPDRCAELVDQIGALQAGGGLLLKLGPLEASAVRAMCVAAGLPAAEAADDAWWERATRLSHGNPGLLRRCLGSLRKNPVQTCPAMETAFAQQIVIARSESAAESAARLPPGPLALLRGLVVCQGLVPLGQVAGMVGLDEDDQTGALRVLRVQGLVDFDDPPGLCPTDRAAAVLADMDSDDRRRLHMEAARSAYRAGADDGRLATLLLTTTPLGDPWVCGVLRRAAQSLRLRGLHADAAELLERALREPLDPAVRADVLLETATIYAVTAPEAGDGRLTELLSAADAPARVLACAADLLLARGETATVRRRVSALYARDGVDAVTRSQLLELYCLADKTRQPVAVRAGTGADMPPVTGSRDGDPAALAVAAWRQTVVGTDAVKVREMGLAILKTAARGPLFPRFTACRALAVADAPQEAREGLDSAITEAERRRSPSLVALGLLMRCDLSLRAGRPETAVRDLAESKAWMPAGSWHPTRVPALRALEIKLLIARERFGEAERLARQELPPGAEQSTLWLHLLYAQAQLLLCLGRPREALAKARECGRWLSARGWNNPGLVPWRSLAALAHLGCDEPGPAASLFTEELRLAGCWGTDTALGWTELRWGLASAPPQAAVLTERAMGRLDRSPTCQGFARVVVTLETAGLRSGESADTASRTSDNRCGRSPADS